MSRFYTILIIFVKFIIYIKILYSDWTSDRIQPSSSEIAIFRHSIANVVGSSGSNQKSKAEKGGMGIHTWTVCWCLFGAGNLGLVWNILHIEREFHYRLNSGRCCCSAAKRTCKRRFLMNFFVPFCFLKVFQSLQIWTIGIEGLV